MRHVAVKIIALALVVALGPAACGELEDDPADGADHADYERTVSLMPEFEVAGTSSMPEELYLSELGLTISEIRLEPVDSEEGSVAYTSRQANPLTFDVAGDQTVQRGEVIELPEAGDYAVSVRLESLSEIEETSEGAAEQVYPSFSVAGFVAGETEARVDPRYNKRTDGQPVPVPFDQRTDSSDADGAEADAPDSGDGWTQFHYESERSVLFTLGEVDFEPGEQILAFEFDVRDWALELVDPLLSAVEDGDETVEEADGGIDATNPLESRGFGVEALFDNASVSSM